MSERLTTICGVCEKEWNTDTGWQVCPACGNDGDIEPHVVRDEATADADLGDLATVLNADAPPIAEVELQEQERRRALDASLAMHLKPLRSNVIPMSRRTH